MLFCGASEKRRCTFVTAVAIAAGALNGCASQSESQPPAARAGLANAAPEPAYERPQAWPSAAPAQPAANPYPAYQPYQPPAQYQPPSKQPSYPAASTQPSSPPPPRYTSPQPAAQPRAAALAPAPAPYAAPPAASPSRTPPFPASFDDPGEQPARAPAKRPAGQAAATPPFNELPPVAGGAENKARYVDVQTGDTLYGISKRYRVKVEDIMAANQLTSSNIAVGQRLVLP